MVPQHRFKVHHPNPNSRTDPGYSNALEETDPEETHPARGKIVKELEDVHPALEEGFFVNSYLVHTVLMPSLISIREFKIPGFFGIRAFEDLNFEL